MSKFDLRTERINRGVTIADLARELAVSRHTIMRIEQGAVPNAPVALKIAGWVGGAVRPSDLWPVSPIDSEAAA